MKKLIRLLQDNVVKLVGFPFAANLLLALADGEITDAEYHALANGERIAELIILALVMVLLKLRNK